MSLIADIKKLRELEQKATPGPWSWYAEDSSMCWLGQTGNEEENFVLGSQTCKACTERGARCLQPNYEDRQMIAKSRNLAPAMIEVLECFKEGDAALLDRFVHIETEGAKLMAGFGKINEHHQKIIDALSTHGTKAVEPFKKAATIVQSMGEISSDRLKRQAILDEMLKNIK